eukprot:CAMPEP_0179406168 /NCGR_PEP_ID=MMETSP0799-20121207/730_1 /TAXON_ID=46947 /ORGANISM="Geminigera cryophila, Strain CCMP2564" /LENGTH=216 /DNA_ID=CAMNT_0021177173 /DNA_START=152 /DNA_END=802 /DNA_ORIENTATION=+
MKDAIPIPADQLDKPRAVAVSHQIEDKYCNRVLLEVGLCVCLHELTELGDGLIYQSDASVHVRAEFTLLVFRPFNGEVLVGTVHKSTEQGLWISIGFFQDIYVAPHFMPDGSVWDEALELWVWKSEYGDAEISNNGPLRFRVNECIFRKVTRPLNAPPAANAELSLAGASAEDGNEEVEEIPALLVMGSIKDDGLGMVVWWDRQQEAEGEEGEAEE